MPIGDSPRPDRWLSAGWNTRRGRRHSSRTRDSACGQTQTRPFGQAKCKHSRGVNSHYEHESDERPLAAFSMFSSASPETPSQIEKVEHETAKEPRLGQCACLVSAVLN